MGWILIANGLFDLGFRIFGLIQSSKLATKAEVLAALIANKTRLDALEKEIDASTTTY